MTLHLVRHGRAAAGWDADPDPGLDATGRGQALAVAARLAALPPRPVATSPYLRCRETAQPVADRWGTVPEVVEEELLVLQLLPVLYVIQQLLVTVV